MSNIFVLRCGAAASTTKPVNNANLITPNQFFGKEGGTKYYEPDGFATYGLSLRDEEVQQLEEFCDFASSGYPIVGALIRRIDKGNKPYVMAHFEVSRGVTVPLKVVVEGNLLQFIKDLQQRKIAINFSLAELLEAAMND